MVVLEHASAFDVLKYAGCWLAAWLKQIKDRLLHSQRQESVCAAASSTYYGNAPPPHQEDMLWVPSSPYAATKYAGELMVTSYNEVYNLPTLNLRFFMVSCAIRQQTGSAHHLTSLAQAASV